MTSGKFALLISAMVLGLGTGHLIAQDLAGEISGSVLTTVAPPPAPGCGCGCLGGCGAGTCGCTGEATDAAPASTSTSPTAAETLTPLTLAQTNFTVSNVGFTAYNISGTNNPTLTLTRGVTYHFTLNASGHPFYIKTLASTGAANAYSNGVTGNGSDTGTLTFAVPLDAPNKLFYNCLFHSGMTGVINIVDVPEPQILSMALAGALALFSVSRRRA